MIPDKIYIHIGSHLGLMQATAIPVGTPDENEYIRKDAILEMLLTMEARHSVFYLEGKIVREIINKISSL